MKKYTDERLSKNKYRAVYNVNGGVSIRIEDHQSVIEFKDVAEKVEWELLQTESYK